MQEFSALLGLRGLENVEENVVRRNELAKAYRENLSRLPGLSFQQVEKGNLSTFKDLTIKVEEEEFGLSRDELAIALKAENIDNRKYFDPPVHKHKAYADTISDSELPVTVNLSSSVLSLPIYSSMERKTVDLICEAIERIRENALGVKNAISKCRREKFEIENKVENTTIK
jgi:dTDP-4-amino-4,6-dideoxygalactose transaminase